MIIIFVIINFGMSECFMYPEIQNSNAVANWTECMLWNFFKFIVSQVKFVDIIIPKCGCIQTYYRIMPQYEAFVSFLKI